MSNNVRLYESVFSVSSVGLFPSFLLLSISDVAIVCVLCETFGFVQVLQKMERFDDDAFEGLEFNDDAFEELRIDDDAFEGLEFDDDAFEGLEFNDDAFEGLEFDDDAFEGLGIDEDDDDDEEG